MGLFTWLFRGEIVEKSLHYYFLSPMRRELLVAGKFLAGLITTSLVFASSVLVCFFFVYGHFGAPGRAYVFSGPGLGQPDGSYLLVTVLACLGFGSIFLALSLIFKNPILPGIVVLLWESFHAVAPSLLQKFSVTFYLKQLVSGHHSAGRHHGAIHRHRRAGFTVAGDSGLAVFSAAILVFAGYRIRRTEISYLAD